MDEKTPLILSDANARQSGSGPVVKPATVSDGQGTVNCNVCGFVVSLKNHEKQIVVKCPNCSEATPIKGAPAGKQYIRCPCNCLLICSSTANRVACPRPECQNIIHVSSAYTGMEGGVGNDNRLNPTGSNFQGGAIFNSGGGTFGAGSQTPRLRVQCTCGHPFTVLTDNRASTGHSWLISCLSGGTSAGTAGLIAAKCPHCEKVTSVGPAYARVRMAVYGILTLIAVIVAVSVTASTVETAKYRKGLYFLWSVLYLVVLILGLRFCVFFVMPVSSVEVPVLHL